jgi:DNA-binding IclR family transcriptional regulator
MTTEEMEIIEYLKQNPNAYFARKEISRRARSRDGYEEDPHWAAAPLNSLVAQGYVEQNPSGHYKLSENFEDR